MAKKPAQKKKKTARRTRMLALEPRMLFDGALGIDLGTKASAALMGETSAAVDTGDTAAAAIRDPATEAGQKPAEAQAGQRDETAREDIAAPAEQLRREIVFVDITVRDYQKLVAAVNKPDAQVVLLDPSRDGLRQIADQLDRRPAFDAIHVISHGNGGTLILGDQAYTAQRLSAEYVPELQRIGRALSQSGDILFYGCDIGKGASGEQFVKALADLTGADIAASSDKTGAADFGGDWILEVQAGDIDARIILDEIYAKRYDYILVAPPIDVGGVILNFANPTLVSGTALQVDAVYKYTNVATINGTQIDAYITVTGITGATLTTIDNNAPTNYNAGGSGVAGSQVWAPEVNVTAANGRVDFGVNFKDSAGNNITLINFVNNSIDVDNAGAGNEFVEYGGFQSYSLASVTDIAVSPGAGGDRMRFTQGNNAVYNGLIVNDVGRVQANFDAITTWQIAMGATANVGNRQYGSIFSAVSFATGSTTVSAPTVDALTTSDTTPILTGTVGTTPLGSNAFAVTVNGTTYTTANGLVINGTSWSLEVPAAIAAGVYDVRAVRTIGSLPLPDQTGQELRINNAPVLADAALSLTTTEDAPVPSGPSPAGALPVSALVGGISDVDAGAVQGVAVVAANEANGTWYYTIDNGATWTPINQIDGTVSDNNALLLANDANTKLYFKPNADYNGSIPGALTIRAWDRTYGAAGSKVDTLQGGGALAFSTASDVIDVTVTPVADAPVNALPASAGTVVNTPLIFSSAFGNAITVSDAEGNLASVQLSVTSGTLAVTLAGGASITAGANGTSTLTIAGTQAAINATLDGLTFTPATGFTGTRTLTVLSTDSSSLTDSDNLTITVSAFSNNPPRIDLDDSSASATVADNLSSAGYSGSSGTANVWSSDWTENDLGGGGAASGDASVVDTPAAGVTYAIRLTDISGSGGTVSSRASIARAVDLSDYVYASLSFDFSSSGNLDAGDSYVVEASAAGINGPYTVLQTYSNDITGTRTVSLAGYEGPNTAIRFRLTANFDSNEFLYIDNVVITAEPTGFANTFTEAVTYVAGSGGVAIADIDTVITGAQANWSGATIRIAGNYQSGSDLLEFTNQNGISGSWDASSGTLTLSGAATKADYVTAIESIRFNNSSNAPSSSPRTITVVGRDSNGFASNVARATINVVGTNDAPSGVNDTAIGVEAGGVSNGTPGTNPSGNVLSNDSDPDPGDTLSVSAVAGGSVGLARAGSYGSVVINADGTFTYSVDNSNAAVQQLATSFDTLYDTFTYTLRDVAGSTSTATLTVTIRGANDAAVIGTPSVSSVTEDTGVTGGNLTASGSITISDADANQAVFSTVVGAVGTPLGALVIAADGTYSYTVSNAATQSIAAGQIVTDTFTVTSADGTTKSVSFTINGSNDAPTINATLTSTSYTDTADDDTFASVTGTLAGSSDVDIGDSLTYGLTGSAADNTEAGYDRSKASAYGTLYLNATSGAYKFVANDTAIEALEGGATPSATFTLTVSDGIAAPVGQTFIVNLSGAEDKPVLTAVTAGYADTADDDVFADVTGTLAVS
ncbi:MAG: DUF4347 domain-containing protein, partial [Betaproteobacteria bacterium]